MELSVVSEVFPGQPHLEHVLRAAQGWYELGLSEDAELELASLPVKAQQTPEVLKLRFHVARTRRKPDESFQFALQLIEQAPEEMWGWLYRSQALHWMGRTSEAFDLLLPVRKTWPKNFEIPYDLACYCAQTERIDDARSWFSKSMALSKNQGAVKSMALADSDLKPLWVEINGGRLE
jgi:predicted Zn-dependent protease